MAEYKCISCGAVKESEERCSCPVCGYLMFEAPYDRAEALRREIRSFIEKLRITEMTGFSFEFSREVAPIRSKLLYDKHIFTGVAGKNMIRLLAPLVLKKEEAAQFISALEDVLSEI